jgi:hypothetical protein
MAESALPAAQADIADAPDYQRSTDGPQAGKQSRKFHPIRRCRMCPDRDLRIGLAAIGIILGD